MIIQITEIKESGHAQQITVDGFPYFIELPAADIDITFRMRTYGPFKFNYMKEAIKKKLDSINGFSDKNFFECLEIKSYQEKL
jgi:hypothetical protein